DAEAQRRKRRNRKPKPAAAAPAKADASKGDAPRSGPADPEQSDMSSLADDDTDDGGRTNVRSTSTRGNTQVFDFTGMNLSGSERKPQLLYFLDRAQEELKRASLERRSF